MVACAKLKAPHNGLILSVKESKQVFTQPKCICSFILKRCNLYLHKMSKKKHFRTCALNYLFNTRKLAMLNLKIRYNKPYTSRFPRFAQKEIKEDR